VNVETIASRFIEALKEVDRTTTTTTYSRKGFAYLPGVHSMNEQSTVSEVVEYWKKKYPNDFHPNCVCHVEYEYPESKAKKADIVFEVTNDPTLFSGPNDTTKWAIEVKRFQFVGDNGKNNDFGVAKMFSPYLKDRSLAHDAERLAESSVSDRKVVMVYGFEYDRRTIAEAKRLHPQHIDRIREVETVCRKNNSTNPSIDFDLLIKRVKPNLEEVVKVVDFADKQETGLWRHPCGGRTRVLAWEIQLRE
jgi:hypothetical protein